MLFVLKCFKKLHIRKRKKYAGPLNMQKKIKAMEQAIDVKFAWSFYGKKRSAKPDI